MSEGSGWIWPFVFPVLFRQRQTEPGQRILPEGQHETGGELLQRTFLWSSYRPHRLHSQPLRRGVAQTASESRGGSSVLGLLCRLVKSSSGELVNRVKQDGTLWLLFFKAGFKVHDPLLTEYHDLSQDCVTALQIIRSRTKRKVY